MRQVLNIPPPSFVNWKQQMLLATDGIGIRDVTLSPSEVWQIIRGRFDSDYNIIVQRATKMQIMQSMGRLYRTRRYHFGRESFGRIEIEPLCDVKHCQGLKFFQFHFTYFEEEVLYRVISWFHPQLMERLKQRLSSISVDATFRCVPTQFSHLVVVMIYDQNSDFYLPVWYMLTSKKIPRFTNTTSSTFEFHLRSGSPTHIVCLRRKMLKLKITEDEGRINGLTLNRRDQGILSSRELNEEIVNRTNNPLERYNRTLNDVFSVPYPDVIGRSQLGSNGCA
ncbi:Hypothetical protein PHPALM_362 [Phytophthora palmivora]|uniref:Uncharacterized protein n=1 Tax=Phytophthora palmivora TaxID=4796 RepID=A0A2P4YV46_9STRA|nr:Hypothetical protein PHPALM_362 [Phytophthora palmivora]